MRTKFWLLINIMLLILFLSTPLAFGFFSDTALSSKNTFKVALFSSSPTPLPSSSPRPNSSIVINIKGNGTGSENNVSINEYKDSNINQSNISNISTNINSEVSGDATITNLNVKNQTLLGQAEH